ncbi:hypothetical protein P6U16_20090 [Rhizobium sp. 32-5/1]|uniref:hypothetical protein n=1 Tax=Rhizobium sp. 32-5/1 TaxID=3019602 RepID=UPI00240DBFAE|nr:hypothetical protein [Rhizobium sp. 32-5/1]WEZ83149.1 hypothetical protein P6U16_20090 [Rhizobium sp. 32-5/1]
MKTILVIAATLGISAPAFAECSYMKNVTAQTDIDTSITTASVVIDGQAKVDPLLPAENDKHATEAVSTE